MPNILRYKKASFELTTSLIIKAIFGLLSFFLVLALLNKYGIVGFIMGSLIVVSTALLILFHMAVDPI